MCAYQPGVWPLLWTHCSQQTKIRNIRRETDTHTRWRTERLPFSLQRAKGTGYAFYRTCLFSYSASPWMRITRSRVYSGRYTTSCSAHWGYVHGVKHQLRFTKKGAGEYTTPEKVLKHDPEPDNYFTIQHSLWWETLPNEADRLPLMVGTWCTTTAINVSYLFRFNHKLNCSCDLNECNTPSQPHMSNEIKGTK